MAISDRELAELTHARGTQKRRDPLTEIQKTWFCPRVSDVAAAPKPSPPRI